MLFSRHYEFVVENGFIHWGRVGNPAAHQRLAIPELQAVEHDTSEAWLYAITQHGGRVRLPDNILVGLKDQGDFLDFVRQSLPQVRILTAAR